MCVCLHIYVYVFELGFLLHVCVYMKWFAMCSRVCMQAFMGWATVYVHRYMRQAAVYTAEPGFLCSPHRLGTQLASLTSQHCLAGSFCCLSLSPDTLPCVYATRRGKCPGHAAIPIGKPCTHSTFRHAVSSTLTAMP